MVRNDFDELTEHIDRVFNQLMQRPFFRFRSIEYWKPAINLYETPTAYYMCIDLAGIDPKQTELKVENNLLVLRGARTIPTPPSKEPAKIHVLEIDHGGFSRTISVPENVDTDRIEANYRKGLLWVKLPKRCS